MIVAMVRLEDIIVEAPLEDRVFDLPALFGREAPVELEIGTGKGGFLLEQARCRPEVNFLGVEWANKYFLYAADRMRRWGVTNVRLIRCDARDLLQRWLPEASIAVLHVYHPDPWPKRRHAKRRLFQPPVVEAMARVLRDSGLVHVQTDHQPYYEAIHGLFAGSEAFVVVRSGPAERREEIVATNFQIKYAREGRSIYLVTAQRRSRG